MDIILLYLFYKKIKYDWKKMILKKYFQILSISLFLWSSISFFIPLPGGTEDAILFRTQSSMSWDGDIGTSFFLFVSGLIKSLSFSGEYSLYLVPLILSLIVFSDILSSWKFYKKDKFLIIIFLFLPANILFLTIPLRESYQLFFFYFSIKGAINLNFKKLFNVTALMSLHKGLLIFGPLILLNLKRFLFLLISILLILNYIYIELPETRGFELIRYIYEGEILNYIFNYRESLQGLGSNTAYFIDESNLFLLTLKSFLIYNFGPLYFFDLTNPIFYFDSIWRVFVFYRLIKRKKNNRMIFLYIIISFIWGLGTVNYGQLIRHHVMHDFILLILLSESNRFNRNLSSKKM